MAVLSPHGQAALRTILHDPSQLAFAPRPILVEIARGWLAHRRMIGVHDSDEEGPKSKKAKRPITIKDIPLDILTMILELAIDKDFEYLLHVTREFRALTKEVVTARLTTCAASLDELFEDTRLEGMGPQAIFACRYKTRSKLKDLEAAEKEGGTMEVLNKNAALDIHPVMYDFLVTFCAAKATWITSKLDSTRWNASKKQLDVLPKWLISTENMEIQKADINRSMIVMPILISRKGKEDSTGALFWVRLIDESQKCSLDMLMQTAHDPNHPPIKKLAKNLNAYHTKGFTELKDTTGPYPRAVDSHVYYTFRTGSADVNFQFDTDDEPTLFDDENYHQVVDNKISVGRVPPDLSLLLDSIQRDDKKTVIEGFYFVWEFYHTKKYAGKWDDREVAIKNIEGSGKEPTAIQGYRIARMHSAGLYGHLISSALEANSNDTEKNQRLSNIQDLIVFKFDVKN